MFPTFCLKELDFIVLVCHHALELSSFGLCSCLVKTLDSFIAAKLMGGNRQNPVGQFHVTFYAVFKCICQSSFSAV